MCWQREKRKKREKRESAREESSAGSYRRGRCLAVSINTGGLLPRQNYYHKAGNYLALVRHALSHSILLAAGQRTTLANPTYTIN